MEQIVAGLVLAAALITFLVSGIWVAVSLMAVGYLGLLIFADVPIGLIFATTVWGANNSWALAALPMFIWIGEILYRSSLSRDLFAGLSPWLARLPGGLLHVNIVGCGAFAAISGSSAATCATIGRISVPELTERKYDRNMIIGTLAGSGTLGLLIPPSIVLIVYGVAIEESVARLFLAGVGPGILMLILFMGYVMVWALFNPDRAPNRDTNAGAREKLAALRRIAPLFVLIAGIIGSIYAGVASPTDAAAIGVLFSLTLVLLKGELNWAVFRDGLIGAVRTSCMITLILSGASFLTVTMGFTGIPRELASWIGDLGLQPYELLFALTILFVILGFFLDGISVVVLTTAIIVPMVEVVGIDLIWFGIFLVLVVEMSQITPPVGFNLFVLQNITGENILRIARDAVPFFVLLVVGLLLITVFPEIAMFIPDRMNN